MSPTFLKFVSLFAASTLGFSALAQPAAPKEGDPKPKAPDARPARTGGGPARQALAPEKAKAAWEVEATAVAKRNALSNDQTKALVKAYSDARESYQAANQKMRDDMAAKGGGGGADARAEMMTAMEDMNKAEKAKFEKALAAASFKPDESAKVLTSLGGFNMNWDSLVDTLTTMKLDAAKQQTALESIEDYVVEQGKIRARSGGADVDREALRAAMTDSRKKLTDSLGKVLSEEQVKTFDEALSRGRGGMGGGGAGGGAPRPADDKKPDAPKKPDGGGK